MSYFYCKYYQSLFFRYSQAQVVKVSAGSKFARHVTHNLNLDKGVTEEE